MLSGCLVVWLSGCLVVWLLQAVSRLCVRYQDGVEDAIARLIKNKVYPAALSAIIPLLTRVSTGAFLPPVVTSRSL